MSGPQTPGEWLLAIVVVAVCSLIGSAVGNWLVWRDWPLKPPPPLKPPRPSPFAPVRCGNCNSEFPPGYWHSCAPKGKP